MRQTLYEPDDIEKLPIPVLRESETSLREVYRKDVGEKIMVKKFIGWKTNKEKSEGLSGYVLTSPTSVPDAPKGYSP